MVNNETNIVFYFQTYNIIYKKKIMAHIKRHIPLYNYYSKSGISNFPNIFLSFTISVNKFSTS